MTRPSTLRAIASVLCSVVLLCGSRTNVVANERTYTPRSEEEVEVLSLVVASEIKGSDWAKSELICFSVDSLDPAAKLVKSLRQRSLNVRSSAEWAKKFNCAFELQLEYTQSDLSGTVKIRSRVVDLREINKGEGDLAILLKDGEYSLRRVDGKWSVSEYVTNLSSDPEDATAASYDVLYKLVGKQVTIRGKFSLRGKFGAYVLLGNQQVVYLVPRGSFAWGEPYSEMEGKLVATTGTLGFYHDPDAQPTDRPVPVAHAPDHFYLEAETAQVRLISP